MELFSAQFLIFLAAAWCIYMVLGRVKPGIQWTALLAASLAFYAIAGGWQSLVYVIGAATVSWAAAVWLEKLEGQSKAARKAVSDRAEKKAIKARFTVRKRLVLIGALAICLGVLGYLKYWETILGYLMPDAGHLGLVLPLGISFFTFQVTGYVIDVYNGKEPAERNLAKHLLFTAYFPQLIQGPINKHRALAPQLTAPHAPDVHGMRRGLVRIALGLFKKFAVAVMLQKTVGDIFGHVDDSIPGALVVVGLLAYNAQLYGDFSGGIDMVEGVSELFGIEMSENFRQPYLSVSIADFWRRWHKSLGVFMRDYLFYPIALTKPMQRFSKWAQAHTPHHIGRTLPACIANLIVFFFVGLWHGAEWHFIAWGMYNGIVVALADLFEPVFHSMKARLHVRDDSKPYYVFTVVRTFVMVNIGRYFDCIASVSVSLLALHNTFLKFAPAQPLTTVLADMGVTDAATLGISWVAFAAMLVVAVVDVAEERGVDVRDKILSWKFYQRVILYVVVGLIFAASLPTTVTAGVTFAYANF